MELFSFGLLDNVPIQQKAWLLKDLSQKIVWQTTWPTV